MALVNEASRGPGRGLPTTSSQRRHAYVLSLAMSFLFFSYIARFGYGVLVPKIIEEMGLSRAGAGLAYSVFTFAYSALSAVSGRLFDKYGIKVVAVLSFVYGLGLSARWRVSEPLGTDGLSGDSGDRGLVVMDAHGRPCVLEPPRVVEGEGRGASRNGDKGFTRACWFPDTLLGLCYRPEGRVVDDLPATVRLRPRLLRPCRGASYYAQKWKGTRGPLVTGSCCHRGRSGSSGFPTSSCPSRAI
jgi:hypothetical protein